MENYDSEKIKEAITEFYKVAGITPPVIMGDVNEQTAEVFHKMLDEAATCSKAMNLVPRPPMGAASVTWLATQLTGALIRSFRDNLTADCVSNVIRTWKSVLEMAIINL